MSRYTVCFKFDANAFSIHELFALILPTIGFPIAWYRSFEAAPKGNYYDENSVLDLINNNVSEFNLKENEPGVIGQSFLYHKMLQFNVSTIMWSVDNVDFASMDFVGKLISGRQLIFGCIYQSDDAFWQSVTDLTTYKQLGKSLRGLGLVKSKLFHNEMEIDISQHYGRIATVRDMLLIAAPYMWFGPGYYKYVPKELLKSFNAAENIEEIGNNNIFIKLFEYKLDPGKSKLRAIQGQFRKWIDMDELEIRLRK